MVDNELKILDYVTSDDDFAGYKIPIIDDYEETYKTQKGEFLGDTNLKAKVQVFVSSAYSAYVANGGDKNALYENILKDCSSAKFYTAGEYSKQLEVKLSTSDAHTITAIITRVDEQTFEKISFLWNAYFDQDTGIKDTYHEDTKIEIYYNAATNVIELHKLVD